MRVVDFSSKGHASCTYYPKHVMASLQAGLITRQPQIFLSALAFQIMVYS